MVTVLQYGNIVILYGTYTTYCLLIYYTYNTVGLRRISFFSEIRSPRSVTPFLTKRPRPPPKKMPPRRSPYRLVLLVIFYQKKKKMGGNATRVPDLRPFVTEVSQSLKLCVSFRGHTSDNLAHFKLGMCEMRLT
jgi:hypothetical protein